MKLKKLGSLSLNYIFLFLLLHLKQNMSNTLICQGHWPPCFDLQKSTSTHGKDIGNSWCVILAVQSYCDQAWHCDSVCLFGIHLCGSGIGKSLCNTPCLIALTTIFLFMVSWRLPWEAIPSIITQNLVSCNHHSKTSRQLYFYRVCLVVSIVSCHRWHISKQ